MTLLWTYLEQARYHNPTYLSPYARVFRTRLTLLPNDFPPPDFGISPWYLLPT